MTTFGFMSAPLKSTNEVDLVKPLTINNHFITSDDDCSEINKAIRELDKLRSEACCQPLEKDQNGLDVLTRYYDQLVAIDNKIIISATQNPVVFKWEDAFDKGSLFSSRASLSISDGWFERVAVLFNIGSLMSQIAAAQQFHTDDQIRISAKLFQQSAGVFAHIRDIVLGMVQQELTPDLMPDTLAALSALMIAQAREAIYFKGHKENMKAASMVKISAQVAEHYVDVQKMMTKDVVCGLWDTEWISILFETAQEYLPKDITGIWDIYPTVSRAHTAAKKDNDFIYHERVADFQSLPGLEKAVLAKPTPITNPITPNFIDMFSTFVPVQVHNATQSYNARKAELVNMEIGRMREATQLMNAILASLNLPAALDNVTSTETIPESIKIKSAMLKQNGGSDKLERRLNSFRTYFLENTLAVCSRILEDEKENDDNMRKQLGTKWSRLPSDQLTGPLVTEIGRYRRILHTASKANEMVREKFEAHRHGLELLSENETELRSVIPGQTVRATGETDAVCRLRQLMTEWNENTNCDIVHDFLKAFAENQFINEEHISKEKIAQMFGDLTRRVQGSFDKQEKLMYEIQSANKKFIGERTGSSTGAERERVLKMLVQASDAYAELKANLEEGTKFYRDLKRNIDRLRQKVGDFETARQKEKEDLMEQLQLNNFSLSAQTAKAVVDDVNNLVSSYLAYGTIPAPSGEPTIPPPRKQQPLQGQPQPQKMFQPQYQPTLAAPFPPSPGSFPSYQQQ
ncbi:unnamed protein product [Caenorhabditis nigoni]